MRIVQTRRNLPCFAVSKTITDVSVITLYDGRLERVCEIHGISGTFVVFIKSGFDPRLLILYVMFVLLLFLKAFLISVSPDSVHLSRNSNCCRWERIKCHVKSRRLIALSLHSSNFAPLNLSLFHPFQELQTLNLSTNLFGGLFAKT